MKIAKKKSYQYPQTTIGITDSAKKLWLVGRVRNWKRNSWDFVAIFDSEKMAFKRCSNWRFFVAPVYLNKFNKGDKLNGEWIGAYYPKYGK